MTLFKRTMTYAGISAPGKKVDTEYVMVDVKAPSHKQQEEDHVDLCDDKVKIAILEEMLQKKTRECVALREFLKHSKKANKWLENQLAITIATEPEVAQH
ncbi:hypothetical protein CMUS01_13071 [Colletotrichum musicola]|uniref:Uncharacterized protein n=1 Tax=Colletotrichum musicola TaxID=2175873 RepID=A0A8H6MY09_9PEZI|nr:hypothetical protein CMUS01_13071 [Colletotrichum musicola]